MLHIHLLCVTKSFVLTTYLIKLAQEKFVIDVKYYSGFICLPETYMCSV